MGYPLDGLSVAPAAAYSLRKLTAAFAGSAARVVRDSDSTTQGIGFSSVGNLNKAALETFCTGTAGYPDVIYDQVGSRDLLQTTSSLRLRIATGGAMDAFPNGRAMAITPTVAHRGYLTNTFTSYTGNVAACAFVGWVGDAGVTSYGRVASLVSDTANDYDNAARAALLLRNNTASAVTFFRASSPGNSLSCTDHNLRAYGVRFDGTNNILTTSDGGGPVTTGSTGSFNINRILLGMQASGTAASSSNFRFCELIIWFADPGATEMAAVLADQAAYWVTGTDMTLATDALTASGLVDAAPLLGQPTAFAPVPLVPDSIAASTNLTGTVSVIDEGVAAAAGDWLTATSAVAGTDLRVTFPTPS